MGTLMVLTLFVIFVVGSAFGSEVVHEDSRCLCKCPDVSTVKNGGAFADTFQPFIDIDDRKTIHDTADLEGNDGLENFKQRFNRSIYLNASVGPNQCDCSHVVLVHLNLTNAQARMFCPRCSCNFQVRNLTVMKVVVIIVIWVISLLVIYMGFLHCLDPVLNSRRMGGGHTRSTSTRGAATPMSGYYREQKDEEEEQEQLEDVREHVSMPGSISRGRVMNRLSNQQTKWKQQVQEQRRNIYDTHRMLN